MLTVFNKSAATLGMFISNKACWDVILNQWDVKKQTNAAENDPLSHKIQILGLWPMPGYFYDHETCHNRWIEFLCNSTEVIGVSHKMITTKMLIITGNFRAWVCLHTYAQRRDDWRTQARTEQSDRNKTSKPFDDKNNSERKINRATSVRRY